MLVRRNILREASKIAGDGGRYSLNAVLVESDGAVVATDGHRLIRFGKNGAPPPDEWPSTDGADPAHAEQVMVPRETAKAVAAIKGLNALPCLDYAAVGAGSVVCTDLETVQRQSFAKVEGRFPRYQNCVPKGEPEFSVTVNAKYLAELLSIFVRTGSRSDEPVELEFHLDGPLCIRRGDDYALLMPMRE